MKSSVLIGFVLATFSTFSQDETIMDTVILTHTKCEIEDSDLLKYCDQYGFEMNGVIQLIEGSMQYPYEFYDERKECRIPITLDVGENTLLTITLRDTTFDKKFTEWIDFFNYSSQKMAIGSWFSCQDRANQWATPLPIRQELTLHFYTSEVIIKREVERNFEEEQRRYDTPPPR